MAVQPFLPREKRKGASKLESVSKILGLLQAAGSIGGQIKGFTEKNLTIEDILKGLQQDRKIGVAPLRGKKLIR